MPDAAAGDRLKPTKKKDKNFSGTATNPISISLAGTWQHWRSNADVPIELGIALAKDKNKQGSRWHMAYTIGLAICAEACYPHTRRFVDSWLMIYLLAAAHTVVPGARCDVHRERTHCRAAATGMGECCSTVECFIL